MGETVTWPLCDTCDLERKSCVLCWVNVPVRPCTLQYNRVTCVTKIIRECTRPPGQDGCVLLVVFLQFILWLGYIPPELRAEAVGVDETQRLPRSFATEAGPAKALPLGYHTTNTKRPPCHAWRQAHNYSDPRSSCSRRTASLV